MHMRFIIACAVGIGFFTGPSFAIAPTDQPQPEAQFLVVAPRAEVASAGAVYLTDGGNAVDAVIAMAWAMCVLEPQVASVGGEAIMLYYDQASKVVTSYDGLARAPAVTPTLDRMRHEPVDGRWHQSSLGGASVGTPGFVKVLSDIHKTHGSVDWRRLVNPAIAMAMRGVPMGRRLNQALAHAPFVGHDRRVRAKFFGADHKPRHQDEILTSPELAQTLYRLGTDGSSYLYAGALGRRIVDTVRGPDWQPGGLLDDDISGYRVRVTDAVCMASGMHNVCTTPQPTAGVSLLQSLAIATVADSGKSTHQSAEASRLALSDFRRWVFDYQAAGLKRIDLLARPYIASRAELILDTAGNGTQTAGRPPGSMDIEVDAPLVLPDHHWASILAMDAEGNVALLTMGLGGNFGSNLYVDGFFLNSAVSRLASGYEPWAKKPLNVVAPHRRPASLVAPLVVKDIESGAFRYALGGGASLSETLIVLQHAMRGGDDISTAVQKPRVVARHSHLEVEADGPAGMLEDRGHEIVVRESHGRLLGIAMEGGEPVSILDERTIACSLNETQVSYGECPRDEVLGLCIDAEHWSQCKE